MREAVKYRSFHLAEKISTQKVWLCPFYPQKRTWSGSCSAFNSRIDFSAQHRKINGFGQKSFSAILQGFALGLGAAISGDHNYRNGPNVRFGSEADTCSAKGHVRFSLKSGHSSVH